MYEQVLRRLENSKIIPYDCAANMSVTQVFGKLNTGLSIPLLGFGTWKSKPNEVGDAVRIALEVGYRHIDCAAIYLNEDEIGRSFHDVFSKGKIKREEVFITSKLWNTNFRKEHVRAACENTLKNLQLSYLDLYLVHWPIPFEFTTIDLKPVWHKDSKGLPKLDKISIQETWHEMEKLLEAGLVKNIGVSNFPCALFNDLLGYAKVVPAANQVEVTPYLVQSHLQRYLDERGVHVTAYSPLGMGTRDNYYEGVEKGPLVLEDPKLHELAKKYNKSLAQVIIRWNIQHGRSVIPKSVKESRIRENFNVFDFSLSEEDVKAIDALDKNYRANDTVTFWRYPLFY